MAEASYRFPPVRSVPPHRSSTTEEEKADISHPYRFSTCCRAGQGERAFARPVRDSPSLLLLWGFCRAKV